MERFKLVIFFLLILFARATSASPYYGATFSHAQIATEPQSMHGDQFLLNYDPQCIQWRQFNIYFDAGFAHFWITNRPYYTALNIYSISPVIRYTFTKRGPFTPWLELSIGLSYLNHTHLDDRNLGIHFAFQDRFGAGIYVGTQQQFSLGIHAAHYSNAHLSYYNHGLSIPLMIDIGYRFSLS